MEVIRGSTANDVWKQAHRVIEKTAGSGRTQPSRTGDTYETLHVVLEIDDPRQRWVVSRKPAINPAFGIAEVIWILAGSNDSAILNYWFPGLPKFQGEGSRFPGSYGHRLRSHFGLDQIRNACEALTSNPDSRQVVLQLWDTRMDLPDETGTPRSPDVPCNVSSLLKVRDGCLEWTQIMRSNDLYRGLPYNFLQFTVLQEVMAGWLGVEIGSYRHWSDSFHAYKSDVTEFSCDDTVALALNSDSLMTDVVQGERLISELYTRLAEMTAPNLSETHLSDITTMGNIPTGYQNLLRILGAETARRRARPEQAEAIIASCTNPQLVQVWTAWEQRMKKRAHVDLSYKAGNASNATDNIGSPATSNAPEVLVD